MVKKIIFIAASALIYLSPLGAIAENKNFSYLRLTHFTDLKTAIRAARNASIKLKFAIDLESLKKPDIKAILTGQVIYLIKNDNKYEVATGLELNSENSEISSEIKKVFPKVEKVQQILDEKLVNSIYEGMFVKEILILGSYKNYKEALVSAKNLKKNYGLAYSNREMIYDKKEGLIWPLNFADSIYAGSYYPRRYHNECDKEVFEKMCLTIERSEFYKGFEKDYYIVIASIGRLSEKVFLQAKKAVPDAYYKSTEIYLGCIH